MKLNRVKLGQVIEQRREKNDNYDVPIRGVSREGFIDAKQEIADTSIYNTFYKNDFVFNPARMEVNSIALNTEYDKAICSSLYEIFYIKDTSILLPEYLNLYIKRDEFARRCDFIGCGSAREYCRVADISEISIDLPPLPIQQKFVGVYNSMLKNQQAYESGLEDLKLTCDAYVERLRREMPHTAIGEFIEQNDERNSNGFKVETVRGLSTSKEMIATKANLEGVELGNYKVARPNSIAYVSDTSRRGEKISLGFNNTTDIYLVSSISTVFSTNKEKLLPEYLMMFFCRCEFDRYARFHSWGSARETFGWEDMREVKIPIPDIKVQQAIINIYNAYIDRREINGKMKAQIKDLCPILIKGSIEEARAA